MSFSVILVFLISIENFYLVGKQSKEIFVEKIRRFRNGENMWWAWPWKYEITKGSEFLSTFFRRLKALFAMRQIFLSNPILNKSLFDPNLLFVNVPKIKSVIGLLWILILACIVHSGPFSTMCQKIIQNIQFYFFFEDQFWILKIFTQYFTNINWLFNIFIHYTVPSSQKSST